MKTVKLKVDNLINAYKGATPEVRKTLQDLVPEINLCPNVMDRVKTFRDACIETGNNPDADYHFFDKAEIIVEALNEGWVADPLDINQPKYEPIVKFRKEGSGVALSYYVYVGSNSFSGVGSRLQLKNPELCKYAVEQFPNEYGQLLIKPKK